MTRSTGRSKTKKSDVGWAACEWGGATSTPSPAITAEATKAAKALNKQFAIANKRRLQELKQLETFIVGVMRGVSALDKVSIPASDFRVTGALMQRVQKLSVKLEQVIEAAAQRAQALNE